MSPGVDMLASSILATSQTTIPKLTADRSNWILWKNRIQILIEAKKLDYIMDDSVALPPKPEPLGETATTAATAKFTAAYEKHKDFRHSDAEVRHFIISTLPDILQIKVINCTSAREMWKIICTDHESKTTCFTLEMKRNLNNQRCSDVDDVKQHFAKMLKLHEELAATGTMIEDSEFTSILTNSLPPSYDNVISSAYSGASGAGLVISTDKLVSVVQEEYSRRKISAGKRTVDQRGVPFTSRA
jgi:hypothetical protein